MQITAYKCRKCGCIIYSRTRHDMHWCSCGSIAVDGGLDHTKLTGEPNDLIPVSLNIDVTKKELYDDWNLQKDRYGLITLENIMEYRCTKPLKVKTVSTNGVTLKVEVTK